jgi:epoxide hydrolase-like predicted phosphatase
MRPFDSAWSDVMRPTKISRLKRKMSLPVVSPTIRAAEFDIGGVLFVPHRLDDFYLRWAKQLGIEPEKLRELLWAGPDVEAVNVGAITAEEYCRRCALRLGSHRRMILTLIEDLFLGECLNAELAAYLGTLKPRIQIAALANTWSFGRRLIERRGIKGLFHLIVSSAEEGVKKPHPHIYEIMLERLGTQAEKVVFVDDVAENVATARMLGIHSIQFRSDEQAVSELEALLYQHQAE